MYVGRSFKSTAVSSIHATAFLSPIIFPNNPKPALRRSNMRLISSPNILG